MPKRKKPSYPDASLLLHDSIPPPLHGLNPRTIFGDRWWDRERKMAYRRFNFRCQACGINCKDAEYHKHLEGHETYAINFKIGLATYTGTVALCHSCHNFIHLGRLESLVNQGQCTRTKFNNIRRYGRRVLKAAGYKAPRRSRKPKPYDAVPWHKWRLKIGRRKYKPIFSSQKEWKEHYADQRHSND